MTEDQHDAVVTIVNTLLAKMAQEVNRFLAQAAKQELLTEEQRTLMRTLLTEQARFWE